MTDPRRLSINQWAEEDRPREKMRDKGAESLSNAELLAILIGSGTPKKSAVELMKDVMHGCGDNLNTLGKMSFDELTAYNGIGPAKAITILAACELGRRRAREGMGERPMLKNAADVYAYMHTLMQDLDTEEAWVLLLNQNFRLIKASRIAHGGITETAIDVRVAMREAILCNATQMVLCHNHPSGSPRPSPQDNAITQAMQKAAAALRLRLADHVIVADGSFYSYADEGRI